MRVHRQGALVLAFFHFFHQFDDLFVVRANFFYRDIVIDNIDDTCEIFAHICLNIIFSLLYFRFIEIYNNLSIYYLIIFLFITSFS